MRYPNRHVDLIANHNSEQFLSVSYTCRASFSRRLGGLDELRRITEAYEDPRHSGEIEQCQRWRELQKLQRGHNSKYRQSNCGFRESALVGYALQDREFIVL